jgi:hypothetical protein
MPKKSFNSYASLNCKGDLVKELGSELNTITLRDKALGTKEGEIIHGVSLGAKASPRRFLEGHLNFIEIGSSHHGEIIARVIRPQGYITPE